MKVSIIIYLLLCLKFSTQAFSQSISYGNNPQAGHFFDVGNCKLYYEVYGNGEPIVLLHGGVYGYIDEFESFIERLSKTYQVICIATRGHGKSEIGHTQYSYKQSAEDVYKVIKGMNKDSVTVLGFSDGGITGLKLSALYPGLVKKLIVIGAGDLPKLSNGQKRYEQYTSKSLLKNDSAFFASRLALMPEPKRWDESLDMLNKMYNTDFVSLETFKKIKCPTLIMAGDKDEYNSTESLIKCKRAIKNSQLSIVAGCGHLVFFCNFPVVWGTIDPFLKANP